MCGITGFLHRDGAPADEAVARTMMAVAQHRGPDALDTWSSGPVAFGHARLSIIDLAGGAQPMHSPDGRYAIVFNGEIFNHVELRAELEARGVTFRTRSDTEVLLQQYVVHGPQGVAALNGQWAFAIWDARERTLFLSRDRLGVRPLFYTHEGGTFSFASEIKSLFAAGRLTPRFDLEALDQVLTFWHALAPRTMFRGVHELPPGCSLFVPREGDVRLTRHYAHTYAVDPAPVESALAEELEGALVDATRLRLVRADVPVGAYVSGGLDSAIVAGIVTRKTEQKLDTFSVTFQSAEFDESEHQTRVVSHLGVSHRSVPCSAEDIGRVFPDVVWHAETALVRTAPAPMYLLSKLVRESGYKVVLTGEGSDELLGGYDIFKEAKVRRFVARHPESTRRPLLFRKLYPYIPALQQQSTETLRAFFQASPELLSDPLFSHLPRIDVTSKTKIFYAESTKRALSGIDARETMRAELPEEFRTWHPFLQAQYLETRYLLPGYILSSQGDRMALAHGIEGRYPFLDPRVAAVAGRIPPNLKMRALDEKHLLKRATRAYIPPFLLARPKQPYRAPVAECFFDVAAQRARFDWVEDALSPKRIDEVGIFHGPAVSKLVDKARRGAIVGVRDGMSLVAIASTQVLAQRFGVRAS